MDIPRTLRSWTGRYWFVVGLLSWLGAALPSIARTYEPMSFLSFLDMSIDWLAACVIYFFIGAVFGHLLDWWLLRKRGIQHPLWWYVTLGILLGSPILLAILLKPGTIPTSYILFFPLMFGIFFTGSAFYALVPGFVQHVTYGKALLDVLFLAAFGLWVRYELTNTRSTLRRVLLLSVLGLLILGLVSCAQTLANAPATTP